MRTAIINADASGCGNAFFGHKRRVICKTCSTRKPVSVSLENCAKAATTELKRQMNGHPIPGVPESVDSWTARGDVQCSDFKLIAKAVLDAAEVKYVE